jgi:hypothetical protein
MRGQLKQLSDDDKRTGKGGALLVLLDIESGTSNVAGVGSPAATDGLLAPLSTTLEEWLMTRLNEGIVA